MINLWICYVFKVHKPFPNNYAIHFDVSEQQPLGHVEIMIHSLKYKLSFFIRHANEICFIV